MEEDNICCANCKWYDWIDRPQLVYEKETLTYCNYFGNVTEDNSWCYWYIPKEESR